MDIKLKCAHTCLVCLRNFTSTFAMSMWCLVTGMRSRMNLQLLPGSLHMLLFFICSVRFGSTSSPRHCLSRFHTRWYPSSEMVRMQPCACMGTTQGMESLCAVHDLPDFTYEGNLTCFGRGNMSFACSSIQLLVVFCLLLPAAAAVVVLEAV